MNWYKKGNRNRGLYNKPQADSYRNPQSTTQERYTENELIEGEHIKVLHSFFTQGKLTDFNNYVTKLKSEGFSRSRIDSMVASATRGKVPTSLE